MRSLLVFLLSASIAPLAQAQEGGRFKVFKEDSENRASIRNSRPLNLYYEKISWNQSPTEIESGYLYLRDRDSDNIMELKLTETKPDSAVFNLELPVGVIKQKQIAAEIYSAPQEMLKTENRVTLIQDLIKDKSVKRKPFLLRVLRERGQIVDVFDDKEQAIAAYNKYLREMGLSPGQVESESIIEVANQEKPVRKKAIDTSTLQSLLLANENDLTASNEKNREMREVLKNLELKRRQEIQADAKTWSASKEASSKKKSTEHIKQAVQDLQAQDFSKSMEKFLQASDSAPFNENIYQQYGVSLFRSDKFNPAIVVLEISQPSEERLAEKNFYIGMSFYKLKDFESAIAYFDKVMASGNASFGTSAAFYKGSALGELQRFEESRAAFQYVLDNSSDPEMDKRAEQFIEFSLDQERLARKRSHWFFMDGVLGLIYDSNIILAADQAREQGLVTDEEGWRLLGQFAPSFRPYYSDSDEVRIALDLTALQSFDEGFGSNSVAERADPVLMGVRVPWTHRGTLANKAYFFDLAPGYQTIMMDLDGTGREVITNTLRLDFNNTLVASRTLIAKGDWFFASNDSDINGDATVADSFAAGLRVSGIYVLNKDLERYLIPEFSYQINDAEGAEFAFNRVDLAVTFTTALYGKMIWNSRMAYFLANYESARVDNNYTLSTGVSTRISTHWTWGLMGSYIINDSNLNNYNKYNVVSTFGFSY